MYTCTCSPQKYLFAVKLITAKSMGVADGKIGQLRKEANSKQNAYSYIIIYV